MPDPTVTVKQIKRPLHRPTLRVSIWNAPEGSLEEIAKKMCELGNKDARPVTPHLIHAGYVDHGLLTLEINKSQNGYWGLLDLYGMGGGVLREPIIEGIIPYIRSWGKHYKGSLGLD